MNFNPIEMVKAAIEAIEAPRTACEFSASRWPHTYAYDYVREHWRILRLLFGGPENWPSRSDASQSVAAFCGGDEDLRRQVVEELASAYLREHGIVRPE